MSTAQLNHACLIYCVGDPKRRHFELRNICEVEMNVSNITCRFQFRFHGCLL